MKPALVSLLLLASLFADAQTIQKFYDYSWKPCQESDARFVAYITKTDSGYVRKDYFLHSKKLQMSGKYGDADCKLHDGYFYYFHANGVLESSGQYSNGKKNGLWLSYHHNGMMSDSSVYTAGNAVGISMSWHLNGYNADSTVRATDGSGLSVSWFDNGSPSSAGRYVAGGQKHGSWVYYHNNGQKSAVESYEQGKLVKAVYYDEDGKLQDTKNRKDADASFAGGAEGWGRYILKKIYFPDRFKFVNGDKAVVVVSFVVDEAGNVGDVVVTTPFYPAFDKIAASAIAEAPKWKPAIQYNRRVKRSFRQPVTFVQVE